MKLHLGLGLSLTRPSSEPPGDALGPELIVNGTFTGNDTTGYTNVRNTNVSGGTLNSTGSISPTAALALSGAGIENDKTYRLVYDLVSYSAGAGSRFAGGFTSTPRTVPGTYSEDLLSTGAAATLNLLCASNTIVSVDNISLKEVL